MSNKAIVAFQPQTLAEFERVGLIFAASGYFQDAQSEAQAIVKIMAGAEMGLGLFESMNGFNIIRGKMSMAANLIATMVKRVPGYDYHVDVLTHEQCKLTFYKDGKKLGVSEFTIEDAQKAKLVKDDSAWEKWPKNMLFARAISSGVRFHCPEVTGGRPVYTPDELGAEVNEQGEPVTIPGNATITTLKKTPHWIEDEQVRRRFWARYLQLGRDRVHEELGVESVKDFTGTMQEAADILNAALDAMEQENGEASPVVTAVAEALEVDLDTAVDMLAEAAEAGVNVDGEPAEVAEALKTWADANDGDMFERGSDFLDAHVGPDGQATFAPDPPPPDYNSYPE